MCCSAAPQTKNDCKTTAETAFRRCELSADSASINDNDIFARDILTELSTKHINIEVYVRTHTHTSVRLKDSGGTAPLASSHHSSASPCVQLHLQGERRRWGIAGKKRSFLNSTVNRQQAYTECLEGPNVPRRFRGPRLISN